MDGVEPQSDVTELLSLWGKGDKEALRQLAPLVYPDLRRLAGALLRSERPGHSLQATGLVHELFLRLIKRREVAWENRTDFFLSAAHLMRLILREWARNKKAGKRGGGAVRIPLNEELAWVDLNSPEMLDLDFALEELAQTDARKAQIAELRFFLGCTNEEAADLLSLSERTVKREVAFIKAWLFRRLRSAPGNIPGETQS